MSFAQFPLTKTPIKPVSLAVSGLLLAACSSTPTTTTRPTTSIVTKPTVTTPSRVVPIATQENAALLDMDSLDELEGLLEATDMTMVENNALLVQRYGNLWDRMRVNFKMNGNLYDPRIEAQKSWFISRQDYLNRLTARASRYLYYTVREAERRNIPTELALLPVIESSYDPNANSNAAAAGLWQFIPSTGRIYGLNQTPTFDGRRDVIESTRAAYDFLTSLYNQFGSWELALAAYNAGPGRIQSAINYNQSRGLPTDYWSLNLPTETMNYVPRFMAVAQIVKNPSNYNVYLPAIANRQHFRSVPANVGVSLAEVSSLTGVSYDELRALNPALSAGSVDSSGPSRILIPSDVNETVDKKITQLRGNGYQSPTYTANSTIYPSAVTTTTPTPLPNSSNDLAAMANSMVKNQTTTYVAPVVTKNPIGSEPPITAAELKTVTAELKSANNLPTTSVTVTPNNTIVQEPPLSKAEISSIAQQIEQTSPQVQQAINPTDGNINLNAVQTQQSVLEAKGETKKLSYQEPPVVLPANVKTTPASGETTNSPKAVVTAKPVVKKPRPTGTRTTYQVKRGDTLGNIATKMGVNWRDIAEWNQIDANAPLLAGTTLYLYNAKPIVQEKPVVKATRPNSYIVQSGDTLGSIADKFGLSVSDLAKYNNLPITYQVKTKQNLWLIPDKIPAKVGAKKPIYQGATTKYTVQSGDTLHGVANKFDTSLQVVADLNNVADNYMVQWGEVLTVPAKAVNPGKDTAKSTPKANTVKTTTYTVKSGESLGSIANDYDMNVNELATLNNLKANTGLKTGQKLQVPATASKTKVAPKNDTKDDVKVVSKYKGATESYSVKSGDSLNGLAAKYNIAASDLAALNGLKPNSAVQRGQTLKVPKLTVSYKVKSGDSMHSLSSKYGISPKELASMNGMTATTQLKIGQTINVPNR